MFTTEVIDENENRGLGSVFDTPCAIDEQIQSVWFVYLKDSSPEKLAAFCRSKHDPYLSGNQCVLYYVAKTGAGEMLKFLLAKVGHCSCSGMCPCPLMGAAVGGQREVLRYLLSSLKPNEDQVMEAVREACQYDRIDCVPDLLAELREDRRQWAIEAGLEAACFHRCVRTVEYLLPTLCTGRQCFCLWTLRRASISGNTDCVRLIISHGQDVNVIVDDDTESTSLHVAAYFGHSDTLSYLISCGAEVNISNKYLITPLHLSAYGLHHEDVTVLLTNGGDVNARDRWGQTPLHNVIMGDEEWDSDRRDVLQTIISHDSNVTMTTDQWGRTPLHLAEHNGYTDIVELFGETGHHVIRDLDRKWLEPNDSDREDMEMAYYW